MTSEDTRKQKRKIAVNLLSKLYDKDIGCLATIKVAEAEENWSVIYNALEQMELFISELKRAIR